MEVETVEREASSSPEILVAVLEQAALMAKQLPAATDPSQLLQILSTFNSAHHHLSLILSNHPPPQSTILPIQPPENSVSSAVGGGGAVEENDDVDDPMLMSGEDEQNSRAAVEKVASRMKECFIQNKRPKRMLSPSAELRRRYDDEGGATADVEVELDYSIGRKLRSLDLIYQFHA